MSMPGLEGSTQPTEDDEAWIQQEIERELEALGDVDDDEEDNNNNDDIQDRADDGPEGTSDENWEEELPPSVMGYFQTANAKTDHIEKELMEVDDILRESESASAALPHDGTQLLIDLARAEGMDPMELKQKVFTEIEQEEKIEKKKLEDLKLYENAAGHNGSQKSNDQSNPEESFTNRDQSNGFLTEVTLTEKNQPHNEPKPSDKIIKEIEEASTADAKNEDMDKQSHGDEGKEGSGEESVSTGDTDHVQRNDSQTTLKPGEGVVAEVLEHDVLERQHLKQMMEMDIQRQAKDQERKQEEALRREGLQRREEEQQEQRQARQRELQAEEEAAARDRQAQLAQQQLHYEQQQSRIQQELHQFQADIEELAEQTKREQAAFEKNQAEENARQEKRRQAAATKIQSNFRGFRDRKTHRNALEEKIEESKVKREEERIKEIELERAKSEEEKRNIELQKQKEEEERKKIEEEKKRRKQEEQRRKEEEQKKKEEEKKRKEEEERKRKEEEKRLKEEEKKRKEEQKREEERKKEEEKRKAEELRKQKEEEERKRQEEEKLQKELEEKRKQEEKERMEEERKKEEERRRKEEDEKRKAEEKRLKEEAQEREKKLFEEQERKNKENNKSRDSKLTPRRHMAGGDRAALMQDASTQAAEVEKKRLSWMKECTPWSKTMGDHKSKIPPASRKPLRRPLSAKTLQPFEESLVLTAAKVSALRQVTTVELHDLPGCNLKTLSRCPQLASLTVNRCGLVTTEGLEDCKGLLFLDLKHNNLELMNVRDLASLVHVDLSHNSLTSIHGLEGCTNIRGLCLANNRITRIGGLEHLKKLHSLDLSHNQLITMRGVREVPTTQVLNVSHNHLPALDELNHLGMLQLLDASSNNLMQVPVLANHVLLSQLLLHDNSISSLSNLSMSWLPSLSVLKLNQNSVSFMCSLQYCVLLQQLELSNNQLLDLSNLEESLKTLKNIQSLNVDGNPVSEEASYRSSVLKLVPHLGSLDGEKNDTVAAQPNQTELEVMCRSHIECHQKMREAFLHASKSISVKENTPKIYVKYYDQSSKLAVDHRYAHEYGDTSVQTMTKSITEFVPKPPSTPKSADRKTRTPPHTQAAEMKNKFEEALKQANTPRSPRGQPGSSQVQMKRETTSVSASTVGKILLKDGIDSKRQKAATRIQAVWRGHRVRRDITNNIQLWLAASTIQATWRGYFTRRLLHEGGFYGALQARLLKFGPYGHEHYAAATRIQAIWRGYRLRKKLEDALNYAKFDDADDIEFAELDMGSFEFNEDLLEKGWTPPDTPQLPSNHPVLGKTGGTPRQPQQAFGKPPSGPPAPVHLFGRPPHAPVQPPTRHGWTSAPKGPSIEQQHFPSGKPPLPPLSRMSEYSRSDVDSQAHDVDGHSLNSHRTHLSKKSEKLSEEWGFKDNRTAELMMQRARKLKYNSLKKKKLSQLDANQRLSLMRKLEQSTGLQPVRTPAKKMPPRKEYFQALQDEEKRKEREKYAEQHERVDRTFEWVHTHVSSYNTDVQKKNSGGMKSLHGSDSNLPRMDPNVVSGRRTQLTSPASMDLQSFDSVSQVGSQRRHSAGSKTEKKLPPIQSTVAPVTNARVGEKLSWRGEEINRSTGWGGGKKRSHRK